MHPINRIIQNFGFKFTRSGKLPQLVRTFPITFDYPIYPKVRWELPQSPNPLIKKLLDKSLTAAEEFLNELNKYQEYYQKIPLTSEQGSIQPYWKNDFISPLDGMSIYAALASRKPKTYLEIGSGNSTKFARQAIIDHSLSTRIISIDPHPRAEIDQICDLVIREPLEEMDLGGLIQELSPNDVLFMDGSHRCLQNSDVTVFFTELIWSLPPGLTFGIHDIFLPFDYPQDWLARHYSEQYILSGIILADQGKNFKVNFPALHAFQQGWVSQILGPSLDELAPGAQPGGCSFWLSTNPSSN